MNKNFSKSQGILAVCLTIAILVSGLAFTPSASAAGSSYIVQANSASSAAELVRSVGAEVAVDLPLINSVSANLTESQLTTLKSNPAIVLVVENSAIQLTASEYLNPAVESGKIETDYPEVVGAEQVWEAGVTGDGVAVAVLDTGVAKMAGLKNNALGENGRIVAWVDLMGNSDKPVDPNGHGTHVAGIVLNSDLGGDGHWNGVAPNADLVAIRVLDENGYGTYETAIAGLQWVVDHKDEYNIRVVNLSLVSTVQSPYWADPLSQAVTAAWANGLTVVVAGGNDGPSPLSINSPGSNPYAITVGAFTDAYTPADWSDDYIANFSSAGPTLDGFTKPDLVAPGGHISSLTPQKSMLNDAYPEAKLPANYFTMAGTSQATGVVSGVAALILSNEPTLTNDQVKMRLITTALVWMDESGEDAAYSVWQQGAGRLNAYDAVFSGNTESANVGMDVWADLNGTEHYEGFGYFNADTGTFELSGLESDEIGKYTSWDGYYSSATGTFGMLSEEFLAAIQGNGLWTDHYDVLTAKTHIWAGKTHIWAGKSHIWAGGYTTWVADPELFYSKSHIWAGKTHIWAGADFFDSYRLGEEPVDGYSLYSISDFVIE